MRNLAQSKILRGIRWVGKDYQKTGIFVVGMSTDQRDGVDWTQNSNHNLGNPRNASRALAAWVNNADEKPFRYDGGRDGVSFQNTAKIFIEGAKAKYDEHTCAAFWGAVAFNNYYQVVVPGIGDTPEQPDIEKSKRALYATIDIIKPNLVLAWMNDLSVLWLGYRPGDKKIGRITPHVLEPKQPAYFAPIVGISHPSRINRHACLEFLLTDSVSKKPIETLLTHLKQTIN